MTHVLIRDSVLYNYMHGCIRAGPYTYIDTIVGAGLLRFLPNYITAEIISYTFTNTNTNKDVNKNHTHTKHPRIVFSFPACSRHIHVAFYVIFPYSVTYSVLNFCRFLPPTRVSFEITQLYSNISTVDRLNSNCSVSCCMCIRIPFGIPIETFSCTSLPPRPNNLALILTY